MEAHNLRHVQNDDGRLEPDTNARDETTGDDHSKRVSKTGKHLNNDTDDVDDTAGDDGPFSTDHVRHITGDDGTEEGTGREDRDNERGSR